MIFLLGCTSSPRYRSLETPARTKEKMILKGISRKTMMIASFYGEEFDGCLTANGEIFDMHGNSAAHKTLPFGTVLKITYPPTGKSVTVIVNDRGPFIPERELDLSYGAAKEIGLIGDGVGKVEVVVVKWGSMEPTEKTKGEK
ncbi:MAG: hypothetical protein COT43_11220 [Candidatus Marinimicrobia bacterium CG08_land_8_20_14_0_20_45_22]|nr:MAG: hypothetical protein COT43_11220 [Candidatus Marinimicrobia bacterium CG08_land_8_20_14_0_20_45_22]